MTQYFVVYSDMDISPFPEEPSLKDIEAYDGIFLKLEDGKLYKFYIFDKLLKWVQI